jgi:predicted transcriptional regulator of viral defense system
MSSSNGQEFHVTDREKTIVDALDRPDLCGGIWHVAQGIAHAGAVLDWERLETYTDRVGSGAVRKRLGYLLETIRPPMPDAAGRLRRWQSRLSEGIADLDPGERRQGIVRRRWHIRDNVGFGTGLER